jgi:hypothetical protein
MNNYSEFKESIYEIGSGSFGSVFKLKKGGEEIVVKTVDLSARNNQCGDML